jgi:hypothetical protein
MRILREVRAVVEFSRFVGIPPFEFENWAVIALGGIPNKVQVGDMGVDGRSTGSMVAKVLSSGERIWVRASVKPKSNGMNDRPHPGPLLQEREKHAPRPGKLGLKERWYPIQVKQKDKVGRPDIDAFEAIMVGEDCEKGFFVSFDCSSDALSEIESFFKRSHKVVVALTVQEILDEHIAKKLV